MWRYGDIMGIDPDLVIPNKGLSVYEDCIAPWRGQKLKKYKQLLVKNANLFDFPIHRPYYKLTKGQKDPPGLVMIILRGLIFL